MNNDRIAVWFNEADKQRYDALGIGTELKDKVKALFYDFLDKSELDKLEKKNFLSHEQVEKLTDEIAIRLTKRANKFPSP
ncbi:hypothetical protein HYT53_03500 [Candidatus Woesearchaeota archaeon]|nr:hypothetical protein [Candidatus Woesearchaeota archaeon]